jgi:Glyoxalase-like domain
MPDAVSRRLFLALTGAALVAPPITFGDENEEVPALLDHILLGCNDLDTGIAFVQDSAGVRAAVGGVHPGRGTRNALLSLGERRYLEIIAPDPHQPGAKDTLGLRLLTQPKLVGWAAHPGDLDAFAKKLREAGVAFEGPTPGSRARPDGRVLHWKTLNLADDHHGLLPFFIEWSADSAHPSTDAPKGCTLDYFEVNSTNPEELTQLIQKIGINLPVEHSDKSRLRALLTGPKGDLGVTS